MEDQRAGGFATYLRCSFTSINHSSPLPHLHHTVCAGEPQPQQTWRTSAQAAGQPISHKTPYFGKLLARSLCMLNFFLIRVGNLLLFTCFNVEKSEVKLEFFLSRSESACFRSSLLVFTHSHMRSFGVQYPSTCFLSIQTSHISAGLSFPFKTNTSRLLAY